MQYKQTPARLYSPIIACFTFVLLHALQATAQSTYVPVGSEEYVLLERLEVKRQTDSILNFSKTKPFSRKFVVTGILSEKNELLEPTEANRVHAYLEKMALMKNIEFVPEAWKENFNARKPVLSTFYKTPANLYEVHTPDFFLAVNPIFQYTVGTEANADKHLFLNSRGISVRGAIANKIGFAASVSDNQERVPVYVNELVKSRKAVPGVGFYQDFKNTAYDYFDARGYISFSIARYIEAQFGYDKNFTGNGHRSLFLSDFSAPYLFLKLNTRIWKLNFQNLFIELNSANRLNADQYLPKKYAAMHHLDVAVTKWLNVGLFEAVVFGRENHFEFGYLNPIIFYRSVEQQSGSADNAVVGIDAKANVAHRLQFYGQFLLDEFSLKELRRGSGWWGNKTGLQLGAKYIDAFGISHLDLQLERNTVRPFTYSHTDSVANYTHYNQPLAHPLGANFREWIATARYLPAPKWKIDAGLLYYLQGKDTGTTNFGSNIFLPNIPPYRKSDYGFEIGAGIPSKTALAFFSLSFEWKPNLFFEIGATWRKENATVIRPEKTATILQGGIRWNMQRRTFLF